MLISFSTRIEESLQQQITLACAQMGINKQEFADRAFRLMLGELPKDKEAQLRAKASDWVVSEEGGPAEQGVRRLVRDILNDAL